jgi:hypothetical protein
MLAATAAALLLSLSATPADEGPVGMRPGAPFPSLASAAPLPDGGSAFLFTAGYPFLSASYAQGISATLDLGAQAELEWLTSEFFAGGTLRRLLHHEGNLDLAFRLRAGPLANFGADWAVSGNDPDVGLQIAPGAVASLGVRSGTLSVSADLPMTLTVRRGGGFVVAPRASVAFETPLFEGWSAGARLGGYWYSATGGAPRAGDPRASVDFAALLTYRMF